MSTARHIVDELSADTVARCRRESGGRYVGFRGAPYCGTQRAPSRADEVGAVVVIDCIAGGRLLLFSIPGDREWMRVVELRDLVAARAAA